MANDEDKSQMTSDKWHCKWNRKLMLFWFLRTSVISPASLSIKAGTNNSKSAVILANDKWQKANEKWQWHWQKITVTLTENDSDIDWKWQWQWQKMTVTLTRHVKNLLCKDPMFTSEILHTSSRTILAQFLPEI